MPNLKNDKNLTLKKPVKYKRLAGFFIATGFLILIIGFYFSYKNNLSSSRAHDNNSYLNEEITKINCVREFKFDTKTHFDFKQRNRMYWSLATVFSHTPSLIINFCDISSINIESTNYKDYYLSTKNSKNAALVKKIENGEFQKIGKISSVTVHEK